MADLNTLYRKPRQEQVCHLDPSPYQEDNQDLLWEVHLDFEGLGVVRGQQEAGWWVSGGFLLEGYLLEQDV